MQPLVALQLAYRTGDGHDHRITTFHRGSARHTRRLQPRLGRERRLGGLLGGRPRTAPPSRRVRPRRRNVPGYELFWTAIREDPAAVAQWLGRDPYPHEIEYARVAAETPHLVLSRTLRDATWPTARIVRDLDELRAFKAQPGGPVYVVGGARLVRTLIDDALLDELRLSVHPVAVGAGAPLLSGITRRQDLELVDSERTTTGRVNLSYRVTASRPEHVQ